MNWQHEVYTSAYVCNGNTGASGSSRPESLITFAAEPPNAAVNTASSACSLDWLDSNGVLGAGEVTSTACVCSAAPADTQ
jgi:hypothetical protein